MLLAARVKALAAEVGLSACGLARAERLPEAPLRRFLDQGYCADMGWMRERFEERLDPRRLWPGARTVIAVASCYARRDTEPAPVLARYAHGRDYHKTMKKRLIALIRRLEAEHPGLGAKPCVDTSAVLEKAWAERAGLGWIGKNGCLITRGHGSWVVLGVLIVDREADAYDAPHDELCGGCRRCLDGCPTGAIVAPGVVDARRCLSYQTIENRGAVPEALAPGFGQVFGCDACQDVCPWNEAGHACEDAAFAPRALAALDAVALAELGPERFAELTQGTAVARARYDGLRRNALLALGAARDPRLRGPAGRLLADPSPAVRAAAAWALAQLVD